MAQKILDEREGVVFHPETGVNIRLHMVIAMVQKAGKTMTNDNGVLTIDGVKVNPVFINDYGWFYVLKDIRAIVEREDYL